MITDSILLAQARRAVAIFLPRQEIEELKAFGSGHIHRTFFLKMENGTAFILQKINTEIFQQAAVLDQNFRLLQPFLQQSDYPYHIAELQADPQGHTLVYDEVKNAWRLFAYLTDTVSFDRVLQPEQAFTASKAFGIFAASLAQEPLLPLRASIPGFHDSQKRQAQFLQAIKADKYHRLAQVKAEVAFLLAQPFCSDWSKRSLPLRLSHNDTKINNILFAKADHSPFAIIDLDTVMPASPLYDFGDMVRTYTSTALEDDPAEMVHLQLPFFEALCAGYRDGTASFLSEEEKEALFPAAGLMIQMQAQRFIGDFLQGDVYYPIDYPEHNLVRGKNQLALLRSMLEQEEEMKMILKK